MDEAVPAAVNPSFMDFLLSAAFLRSTAFIVFLAVALTALVLVVMIFNTLLTFRKIPEDLSVKLCRALEIGDLNGAINACTEHPSVFSSMLLAGFDSVSGGYDAVMTAVSLEADVIRRRMMRKVKLLSGCALILPALGLFFALSGLCAALVHFAISAEESAQILALHIASAVTPLALGILISIPIIILCYVMENLNVRTILRLEDLAHKRIRILSNARVEDVPY